jgi:hypothetical protein
MTKSQIAAGCALAALVAAPCRADDFCNGVKTVVAAAATDFAALRGTADAQDPQVFRPSFLIPGARPIFRDGEACLVVHAPDWSYSCSFPTGAATAPEVLAAVKQFSTEVAACFGVTPSQLDEKELATARIVHIPIAAADLITGLSFGPDGGGTLYLGVEKRK